MGRNKVAEIIQARVDSDPEFKKGYEAAMLDHGAEYDRVDEEIGYAKTMGGYCYSTETPGQRLRAIRKLAGLSRSELSLESGIARDVIVGFENGSIIMDLEDVTILATVLQVHPAVIAFPNWGKTPHPALKKGK